MTTHSRKPKINGEITAKYQSITWKRYIPPCRKNIGENHSIISTVTEIYG
jgi:hypothetical protein